jgi:amino acid adenylation domain-containing protein
MTRGSTTAQDRGVDHLFDALDRWSTRTPTATAVSAPDGTFDFAELARRTCALTGVLAGAGVGRGSVVGLGNGRSRNILPAWLAVWRLGATAVPLDDRFPPERLNFMLRDAGAEFLLADRIHSDAVPPGVHRVDPAGPATPVDDHPVPVSPDACAYLIYTSGTTGWPKGVEITYRGLGTFLSAIAGLGLAPGGMGINPLSPGFDGWLWCTLLYLLHGQGMAIIDLADGDSEHADLAARVAAVAPRTVCLTPSLLASCVDVLSTVDTAIVAGEPCPRGLIDRLVERPRVLNVYGPTEATIAATWADSARGDDVTTIGRPLPGYRVHVLDAAGEPVPVGTTGELYIAGPAVARGYRNRPVLTDDWFVPGPGGDRCYRTGDLVTVRPDGLLEYAGRQDDQVKVRGFRVELREIEQVAQEHEAVTAAAAFVDESGQTVGLATVPAPGHDPDPAAIRDHCRNRLPAFMVPAAIDLVAALPVTLNGKVDRAALARASAAAAQPAGRPPATAHEIDVCAAFGEVLEREINDVDVDFFELGGHSLLAARVVNSLRRRTGIRISMQSLLGRTTPASLAAELDRLQTGRLPDRAGRPNTWLVPWSEIPAERPTLLCVPPAGLGSGRYQEWQAALGPDVSVIGVAPPGRDDRLHDPHPSTLDEMVTAITREVVELVKPDQPLVVFGESFGGMVAYEITRRLGDQGRWPTALVIAATEPPHLRQTPEELLRLAGSELPADFDDDTRELVLELVRRDVELTGDYQIPSDPGVDTPVLVCGGDDDDLATPEKLDQWSQFLDMPVQRRRFPGGHPFALDPGSEIPALLGSILRTGELPC